jgi:hypothetical protein
MQLRARLEEAGYIKNWFLALVSKIGFIKKTRRAYAWNLVFFLKKSISCFFRCTLTYFKCNWFNYFLYFSLLSILNIE